MNTVQEHKAIINGIAKEYSRIISNSTQGVYIYLDDRHKVCNEKFARMLGYSSPEEWANIKDNFPTTFVARKSQEKLIVAFQEAIEKSKASNIKITWKDKMGIEVDTEVMLVPISYKGHSLALHFVSESHHGSIFVEPLGTASI
jgi:PAS domain-containing protein